MGCSNLSDDAYDPNYLISDAKTCASAPNTCALGDTNEDGSINILDIVQTVNYILGDIALSETALCNADINADGDVNILDVMSIMYLLVE